MQKITGYNLVSYINQLPKGVDYNYINPSTKGLIRIVDVALPEGPITIRRWTPSEGETFETSKNQTISTEMIWRVANALFEGQPINIDRVLAGSYNTRSVLESLIAHTPQFYYCYPGRVFDIAGHTSVEHGHKHLLWMPSESHANGVLLARDTDVAISEIPTSAAVYDALSLPDTLDLQGMDIEVARRHTQIQIALYLIGLQLGYRTWIAQNDKGIRYQNKPLIEQAGIVRTLQSENLVSPYDGAVNAGLFIDCIWFKNGRLMPAVMEVEHTTGVTSGLTRMLNFYNRIPPIQTRYVIVAPDEDRDHIVSEANKPMFRALNTRYFPYSSVEELYVISQRRKLRGITEEFLDCYMESVVV
ncbi:MAG: restriction endonuclease [Clostridia bacterium]